MESHHITPHYTTVQHTKKTILAWQYMLKSIKFNSIQSHHIIARTPHTEMTKQDQHQ